MISSYEDFLTQLRATNGSTGDCLARAEELAEEAAANAQLADVGEVSGTVAHEFNNFLNALMLHLAVLQYKPPEAAQGGLAEVRRQAVGAAALIQQFQGYRRRGQDAPRPVDLNRAVRAAVRALGRSAPQSPRLDLAAETLPVMSVFADLQRLCLFLLRNAAAAADGDVAVHTSRSGKKIVLRVEDSGPPLDPQTLAHLFEPTAVTRDGVNALELAACRALVRRGQGSIHGENRPEGGAAVVVEWNGTK